MGHPVGESKQPEGILLDVNFPVLRLPIILQLDILAFLHFIQFFSVVTACRQYALIFTPVHHSLHVIQVLTLLVLAVLGLSAPQLDQHPTEPPSQLHHGSRIIHGLSRDRGFSKWMFEQVTRVDIVFI